MADIRTIELTDIIMDSRGYINDNFQILKRSFNDIEFPDNPVKGQKLFRDGVRLAYDGFSWKTPQQLHNHSGIYYSKSEVKALLLGKSDNVHYHDDILSKSEFNTYLKKKDDSIHYHDERYYTETEMNSLLNNKGDSSVANSLNTRINNVSNTISGKSDDGHGHAASSITGKGTAALKNTGTTKGTIPVLQLVHGYKRKIPSSLLSKRGWELMFSGDTKRVDADYSSSSNPSGWVTYNGGYKDWGGLYTIVSYEVYGGATCYFVTTLMIENWEGKSNWNYMQYPSAQYDSDNSSRYDHITGHHVASTGMQDFYFVSSSGTKGIIEVYKWRNGDE